MSNATSGEYDTARAKAEQQHTNASQASTLGFMALVAGLVFEGVDIATAHYGGVRHYAAFEWALGVGSGAVAIVGGMVAGVSGVRAAGIESAIVAQDLALAAARQLQAEQEPPQQTA